MSADLTHIDTWLFDLDNTLYPMDSGFMGQIEARMTDYVQRITGLEREPAYRLQKQYLAQYGLTLGGLIEHWGVDPADYHAMFHDLSLESLAHDPRLIAALERLPGRRLIFTNSDEVHARRVMQALGLSYLFDEVFHIGSANYLPKPAPATFAKLVADHAVDPAATCFFEDRADNLAPAFDLGMTTVLVGPHAEASSQPFVRYKAANLSSFLEDALLKDAAQ
ncbi:pyrimidine 5'-nucleotidase [Phenylobacterium sp.]|jgi:putative hydrolase of the HAD superfamily|uniref:pyrimidine 5'-nucleotidase n=1 Tax=Phenylobacterium sp. TaxID=1871053 RepID=UPI002F3E787C